MDKGQRQDPKDRVLAALAALVLLAMMACTSTTSAPVATTSPTPLSARPLPSTTAEPTAMPRPTPTPRPTATPRPTSTPLTTATRRPTRTPRPTATPTPSPFGTDVVVLDIAPCLRGEEFYVSGRVIAPLRLESGTYFTGAWGGYDSFFITSVARNEYGSPALYFGIAYVGSANVSRWAVYNSSNYAIVNPANANPIIDIPRERVVIAGTRSFALDGVPMPAAVVADPGGFRFGLYIDERTDRITTMRLQPECPR